MGTVTYNHQPAIHETRGAIPLAGNSRVYKVSKLLWPEDVEKYIGTLFIGSTLHLCCGMSLLGTVRLDLYADNVDIKADAAHISDIVADDEYDTVLCDPPYNGDFQWNHDLLATMARVARKRIILQHWFVPVNKDGLYKKAQDKFQLSELALWMPQSYFGRAQIISTFDRRDG